MAAKKKIDISNDRAERKRMTDAKKRRQTSGQNVDAATRNPTIRAKQNQRLASMAQAGKSGASGKAAIKAAKDGAKDRAKAAKKMPIGNLPYLSGTKIAPYNSSPFAGSTQVEEARQRRAAGGKQSKIYGGFPIPTSLERIARGDTTGGVFVGAARRADAQAIIDDYRRRNNAKKGK
jgi:hypothetical protein